MTKKIIVATKAAPKKTSPKMKGSNPGNVSAPQYSFSRAKQPEPALELKNLEPGKDFNFQAPGLKAPPKKEISQKGLTEDPQTFRKRKQKTIPPHPERIKGSIEKHPERIFKQIPAHPERIQFK